ncbi:MAG: acetolactate synthase [Clostridia bacterium]|nr:acetolactate synthase [Clostridia bacterium]
MKQISVFIENEKGKLAAVTELLASRNVNLKALCIADSVEYGILRLATDEVDVAVRTLTDNGYLVKVTEVLVVKTEDKAGSLAKIMAALGGDIDVEYAYAFTSSEEGKAMMVFRVDDNEKAMAALRAAGISATL